MVSHMNIGEIWQLKEKAISYCGYANSTECKWFYRNKSQEYFQDVLINHHGLMKTYIKDNSGDPRSPINSRLNGLFFMATHENGAPPPTSAFGPVRFQVPAEELLRRTPNIYFVDFYCMQSDWHYVTLVATSRYSSADSFCRNYLLPLNLYNKSGNPFLFYDNGQLYVANRGLLNVEIFFTDDIPVFKSGRQVDSSTNLLDSDLLVLPGARMSRVQTFGRGSSTPGGIRKNPRCTICNLKPLDSYNPFSFFV